MTDNGSHFILGNFSKFCKRWKIELRYSTLRYPQGNGQAKATNKMIVQNLKKKLEAHKGRWAYELQGFYELIGPPLDEQPMNLHFH